MGHPSIWSPLDAATINVYTNQRFVLCLIYKLRKPLDLINVYDAAHNYNMPSQASPASRFLILILSAQSIEIKCKLIDRLTIGQYFPSSNDPHSVETIWRDMHGRHSYTQSHRITRRPNATASSSNIIMIMKLRETDLEGCAWEVIVSNVWKLALIVDRPNVILDFGMLFYS